MQKALNARGGDRFNHLLTSVPFFFASRLLKGFGLGFGLESGDFYCT